MEDTLPDDLIDIKQAARIAHNTHRNTVRRWVLSGKLRGYRLGSRKMLISKRDLLAFIRPIVPTPQPRVLNGKEYRAAREWTAKVLKDAGIT